MLYEALLVNISMGTQSTQAYIWYDNMMQCTM